MTLKPLLIASGTIFTGFAVKHGLNENWMGAASWGCLAASHFLYLAIKNIDAKHKAESETYPGEKNP